MYNGICNCATHCAQSPHHDYACCRSQECDCWCHQIVSSQHKTIVAQASTEQRKAAERAYDEHRRTCARVGIEPENYGRFIAEWLEVQKRGEVEAAPDLDGDRDREASIYYRRDYERQYDGKRGWD